METLSQSDLFQHGRKSQLINDTFQQLLQYTPTQNTTNQPNETKAEAKEKKAEDVETNKLLQAVIEHDKTHQANVEQNHATPLLHYHNGRVVIKNKIERIGDESKKIAL